MNYGITKGELEEIKNRDKTCVYCHKEFDYNHMNQNRRDWDTIEHLNHRADWYSVESYHKEGKPVPEIIAICCASCNSSRGSKPLKVWFKSKYCIENNINYETVDEVVQSYIKKYEP